MSLVVLLSWDPAGREVKYVEVNSGSGGTEQSLLVGVDWAADVAGALQGVELPRLAEMDTADDGVLIDEVDPRPVLRCGVRQAGPPSAKRFIADAEKVSSQA